MNRRTYLQTAAGAGFVGLAGCSGGEPSEPTTTANPLVSDNTYLEAPKLDGPAEAYPWPVHGQELPAVTLPAPLADTEVSTTGFDRPTFVTFFYTNCQTTCPILISALRNIQAEAGNEGYGADIAFLPITFDPERDDTVALESYVDQMNVDFDAGNWQFLRPEGKDAAKSVVQEQFGIRFERTYPEEMDMYMFNHRGIVLLANSDNYVERAYRELNSWKPLYEDFRSLHEAEA